MIKYFLSSTGFLLSVLMIFSCSKKENADIGFLQGTFSSKNTVLVYDAELYTKNGKVSSKSETDNFIKNKGLATGLSSLIKSTGTLYMNIPMTIEFSGEDAFYAIAFSAPYASGTIEKIDSKRYLLTSNDSTTRYDYLPPFPEAPNFPNCDVEFLNIFPQSLKCTVLPSSTGYTQVCKTKIQIPIQIKNGNSLVIPLYSAYYSWNSSTKKGFCSQADQSNFIKEDFYKNLLDGDTVLIQRKEHLLEKM